jgi:hypothetical protein
MPPTPKTVAVVAPSEIVRVGTAEADPANATTAQAVNKGLMNFIYFSVNNVWFMLLRKQSLAGPMPARCVADFNIHKLFYINVLQPKQSFASSI